MAVKTNKKENFRTVSLPVYIAAFVITAIIFAIGVYAGTLIDRGSLSNVSSDVEKALQRLESAQLLLFLDDSTTFCPVYAGELQKLELDTRMIGQKLDLLADKGSVDTELKRQYFILEGESYLLSKKINDKCNATDTLVLYFYSNKNCEKCREHGENLLRARDLFVGKTNKTVKIYSFDAALGSPIADAFRQMYDVSFYPTIVVNEKRHSGYKGIDDLVRILER